MYCTTSKLERRRKGGRGGREREREGEREREREREGEKQRGGVQLSMIWTSMYND